MKKRILALLLVLTLLVLGGCTVRDTVQVMGISVTTLQELADAALSEDTEAPESGEQFVTAEDPEVTQTADTVDAHVYYYDAEHVVLYLDAYGHLPENYITKSDAAALKHTGKEPPSAATASATAKGFCRRKQEEPIPNATSTHSAQTHAEPSG